LNCSCHCCQHTLYWGQKSWYHFANKVTCTIYINRIISLWLYITYAIVMQNYIATCIHTKHICITYYRSFEQKIWWLSNKIAYVRKTLQLNQYSGDMYPMKKFILGDKSTKYIKISLKSFLVYDIHTHTHTTLSYTYTYHHYYILKSYIPCHHYTCLLVPITAKS